MNRAGGSSAALATRPATAAATVATVPVRKTRRLAPALVGTDGPARHPPHRLPVHDPTPAEVEALAGQPAVVGLELVPPVVQDHDRVGVQRVAVEPGPAQGLAGERVRRVTLAERVVGCPG